MPIPGSAEAPGPLLVRALLLVFPALLINYFGQGAKVLADPAAIENPFYRLVPDDFLLPMVVLATAATVIASQAVITGAYSLVHQAIQLGMLPRLTILHTSASHVGQIYIPRVTLSLMVGVLLLVGLFRTSSALASAYGIAVATTMVVDGLLAFIVIWKRWEWPLWQSLLLIAPFVFVDVIFFSANFLKLFEGAWAPLLFGATMVLLILTWRRGTGILVSKTRRTEVPLGGPRPQRLPSPPAGAGERGGNADRPGVTSRDRIGAGSYEDPGDERRRKGRPKKSGRPGR